jgi:hypothetical protein
MTPKQVETSEVKSVTYEDYVKLQEVAYLQAELIKRMGAMQALIQEMTALRAQLNKAEQALPKEKV